MEEQKITSYTIKVKPNTYEYGKAGNRHTIAYDNAEDLKEQIEKLKNLGFWDEQQWQH